MPEVRGPVIETTVIRAGQKCPHPYVDPSGFLGATPAQLCTVCFGTGRTPVNLKLRKHAAPKGGRLTPANRISFQFPDGRGPGSTYEDLPSGQRSADPIIGPEGGFRAYERAVRARTVA